ncbi:hypothetical protein EJ357_39580 [Streptomyces cyaneochromogenes]|uniref:Uncharacterized protein n=1 Tax=Streptomyces cyaneochromogenes TaxID=2496836 RepID=A0A3S9MHZ7_9ACTN|nr:hypothetical protein [Streptomyces cyaneochromogenes]AZQ38797.1 hypothetical protein EJ357_39580 [Streptomyces cyaneochromogenes]
MNPHDTLTDPDEHVRFAAHLDELRRVADVDEVDLVRRVLTDPDPTMAQSAVLRHLDRRAAGLCPDPAYEAWVRATAQAVSGRPFAEAGRTKRIRNTAEAGLDRRTER